MIPAAPTSFGPAAFLANAGLGRRMVELESGEHFFSQGDAADSVFYLQKGRARVTVVSKAGKEPPIMLLPARVFVGHEPPDRQPAKRNVSLAGKGRSNGA